MLANLSFNLSYSVWLTNYQNLEELGDDENEQAYALLDELETIILRHVPCSADEAVSVLNVVKVNVETGSRSDGLDVVALANVIEALPRLTMLGLQSTKSTERATAA